MQSGEVEVVWLRHESERESQELGVGRMQPQRGLWGALLQEIFGFQGKTFKRYTRQNQPAQQQGRKAGKYKFVLY